MVGLVLALVLVPTATTHASWNDVAAFDGAATAGTATARKLQCVGSPALSKDVTWLPFTSHPYDNVNFYEVTVNGVAVSPVKEGSTYSITVNLGLVTLLGSVTVSVTAWAGSSWVKTSTITLGRSLLGLSLGFSCP
ncbi:hypothetical protein [Nocardioides dokdonensis]|uniref:hypothetical protein n=1 Tax=Nocardioides dokdonensis TaxID=450734 RepID=UPI0012FB19BD|nr:hypothetical protein [Nocardioides dokdonensis]